MKSMRFSLPLLASLALTFSLAVCAQAQTVTYLAKFNDTNGHQPYGSMIQATDGNFYGTAAALSSLGGEIFRVTPTGEIRTLYTFCSQSNCADGTSPRPPILGSDGNLYGVTYLGGDSTNSGTVYKLTLDGKLTTLHSFHCPTSYCNEGAFPTGIIQASDGNFYGTTYEGGTYYNGTLFKISATGEFKVLYTFCSLTNCVDGGFPDFAPPIQGRDGNFYGTASEGGTSGGGVLYQLTPAGAYKVLYNFCYDGSHCSNNAWPTRLVQDANGNLFGTTAWAGSYNSGSAFELTSAHRLTLLHTFVYAGKEDAATGLTLANDGNLYGVALNNDYDSNNGYGSIFEITPVGVFTTLYGSFNGLNGPLFQGTDGSFYGTTQFGGEGDDGYGWGTVFKFSNGLSPLVKTVPVAGKVGKRVLILGNGLTGTTSVTFNGVAAAFTVESDTYIKATVPKGATTGTVSVVTPSGTLDSNPQFVVTK